MRLGEDKGFLDHLADLQRHLVRAVGVYMAVCFSLFPFRKDIYAWLSAPLAKLMPVGTHMISTDIVGVFTVPIKTSMVVALLIVLPYVLYELWRFVKPALYLNEQGIFKRFFAGAYLLFLTGSVFAYQLIVPNVINFMVNEIPENVQYMTDINNYYRFIFTTVITFGIAFQMPIFVMTLTRLGVVSVATLKRIRGYVLLGIFTIAAVVTPPDLLSQFLLAVPMYALFEIGLWLSSSKQSQQLKTS